MRFLILLLPLLSACVAYNDGSKTRVFTPVGEVGKDADQDRT
ncbi:hypothetical protein [Halovulum sp. GXIMD14793]